MKKIISLFTSLLVMFSIIIANTGFKVLASSVELIKVKTYFDITSDGDAISGFSSPFYTFPVINNVTNKTVGFLTQSGISALLVNDSNGTELKAVKCPPATSSKNGNVGVNPNNDASMRGLDNVLLRFTGKFYSNVSLEQSRILVEAETGQAANRKTMYVTDNKGSSGTSLINANTWYNFVVELDMRANTGKNLTYIFESQDRTQVLSDGAEFGSYGFGEILMTFTSSQSDFYSYWADIKVETIGESITKAELISVGSSGEVLQNQNNVEFVLNKSIDGLTKEHISVIDTQGTIHTANEITVTSAGTDSDGDGNEDMKITATMSDKFLEWSNYTLNISNNCYNGYKELYNDSLLPVSDLIVDFHTPAGSFGIKEPQIAMSDGDVVFTTQIINENAPTPLTVMLAVYNDSTGEMISLKPVTISDSFTAAYPGFPVTVKAGLSAGQRAELFIINGWSGMRPLFGKLWKTSYSELNS